MLNALLKLARPLFVVDCESTGVDPQQDRIVELGFQQWTDAGMIREWRTLVNPGIPIPTSATKIHGIGSFTLTCCQACGKPPEGADGCRCEAFRRVPTFKQLAANLAKGFSDCDFAGQNVRFDLRLLAAEMLRARQPWSYAGARIVDAYQLERLAVPRNLSALHEKYVGRKHDGAHGALSDVRAAATVILKQLEAHDALPRDLDALHALSWPGFIDPEGKFRFVEGVACVAFGKWNGKPMKGVDPSYWDWILSNSFSAEVKQVAADAKLGKFPTPEAR